MYASYKPRSGWLRASRSFHLYVPYPPSPMASQLKETMDTAEAARRAIRSVPGMVPIFLCSAARRAPRTAPVTQPVPTRFTRRLFSWPKAARKIRSFPPLSEIQQSLSTAPVSRITMFRSFSLISLKNAASSSRWENVPTLSTPLWAVAPVSTVWISELFPFSTPDQALPGHEAAHRLADAFFRYPDAPAPTGSRTAGIPRFPAV